MQSFDDWVVVKTEEGLEISGVSSWLCPIYHLKIKNQNKQGGVPWWLSGFRIQHCHCCGSNQVGSLAPELLQAAGTSNK